MVITVACSSCGSTFPVDPAKIPVGGVNARCSSCGAIFRVERPTEAMTSTPATASGFGEATPQPPTEATADEAARAPVEEVESEPGEVAEEEGTVEERVALESDEHSARESDVEEEEPAFSAMDEAAAEIAVEESAAEIAVEEPSAEPFVEGEAGTGWPTPAEVEPEPEAPSAASESPDEWVIETEEEVDLSAIEIEPVGTVEEGVETAKESILFESVPGLDTEEVLEEEVVVPDVSFAEDESRGARGEADVGGADTFFAAPAVEEAPGVEEEGAVESPAGVEDTFTDIEPAVLDEPSVPGAGAEAPEAPAAPESPVRAFTFGREDPQEKARRLARVLVSDMIMYNPERHERALGAGTLKEDFADEIEKSWKEYVEQVGQEMAESTTYWVEALNDVLAKGQPLF